MAGSRALFEDMKKESSFERSRKDIADNISKIKSSQETPKASPDKSYGLVGQAIRDILDNKSRTKRAIDEAGN